MADVTVIGGGLAGSEAAWQAAELGCSVELWEMRPVKETPAHRTEFFAELVCSNSLGNNALETASGLLKEELRRLGSVILRSADANSVPAGGALGVAREGFPRAVTETVHAHPNIDVIRGEMTDLPEGPTVIATGPLTSDALVEEIEGLSGETLYFYDAASPIVHRDSLDDSVVWRASRYDKGEAAYLNCPMNREQYLHFWTELCNAEQAELKDFERETAKFFEACLPIEEMARRGEDTMRYGPLKPVGLFDARLGDFKDPENKSKKPYAVVQLRQEDKSGQLWNMEGFQTNLRWGEQARVFRLIPGLENAEFVRMGVMHRNTFLNSPELLHNTLQFKARPTLLAAGQLVGTEGYTAAVAGGWLAGTNAARLALGQERLSLPATMMLGALVDFITSAEPKHFQPMPPNFGILPPLPVKVRNKRERYGQYRDRAFNDLHTWASEHGLDLVQSSLMATA